MTGELIRFSCPQCGKRLKAPPHRGGKSVRCPKCSAPLKVPARSDSRPDATVTLGWERVESDMEPPIRFPRLPESDEGVDMTPMVDVTFLLLIFFMITAAFSLQKSLDLPPPDQTEGVAAARTIEEFESDDDFIVLRIDSDDTIWVDEAIAHSEQEMLAQLRRARERDGGRGPNSLLVMASGDAHHEWVVRALDAGNAVGIENVRLATENDDVF